MNIFIMILVALFMAGYYWMSSPGQQMPQHTTEYAITKSDLRMVAQCATAMHNAQINGQEFDDVCVSQNGVTSKFICLDNKLKQTKCEVVRNKKPAFSYIVTATSPVDATNHNSMMEVLETYYTDAGTFGLFQDKMIMSGGTSTKRVVPAEIIKEMELTDGQLVYLTQYEIPDAGTEYEMGGTPTVICPAGMAAVYRFGRWQCITYNTKTDCGGDMVWDSDLYECVPDQSRRPLCASNQTAVIVDSVWECVNPFPERSCPGKMVARLNYNTLEWECVAEPGSNDDASRCAHITAGSITGGYGATLLIPQTSCTDCERMVVDSETCVSRCVPDPAKLRDRRCYPGSVAECTGSTRAFYFGFPSRQYAESVESVSGIDVPLDASHAQNRRFNCLDCGGRNIDASRSRPPFVAVCEPAPQ